MGNIRFTCEGSYKKCDQPRQEATIYNENGHPQFRTIICTTCMGVVASEKLELPKVEKKTRKKPIAPELSETEIKVQEEQAVEVVAEEVPAVAVEPVKEAPAESGSTVDAKETLVAELESQGKTAVEIILSLKTHFGMSNAESAKYLRDRKAAMETKETPAAVVQETPAVEATPVVEETPVVMEIPLKQEEQKQKDASPIKPTAPVITEIPETVDIFPIHFFELMHETKSYKFKLFNPDGVEFIYEVTPNPEKFEAVSRNQSVFDGRKLKFKYSKIDNAGCPINPALLEVV